MHCHELVDNILERLGRTAINGSHWTVSYDEEARFVNNFCDLR